jgi:serine protease Do
VVTLSVKVGELKEEKANASQESAQPAAPKADALGLTVTSVPEAERAKDKIKGGVKVTDATDPAASAGINAGDIILTVNNVDVTGPDQFAKLVSKLSASHPAALLVLRGNQTQWVTVTPEK